MIYSPNDVKKILDEVYERIYRILPNPTGEELDAIKEAIESVKENADGRALDKWAYASGPNTLAGNEDL